MGIRKPVLSVQEARRLSTLRPLGVPSEPPAAENLEPMEQSTLNEPVIIATPVALPVALPVAPPIVQAPVPRPAARPPTEPENKAAAKAPAPAARPAQADMSATRQSAFVTQRKRDDQHINLTPTSYSAAQRIMRTQVFVSAHVPTPGVSRSFDLLSRQYAPEKALQMILRRAMDDYEERLSLGSYDGLPDSYPCDSQIVVYTSRMMPRNLLKLAREHFDPLGFESTRAFGYKLANAALASFFANEPKPR